MVVASKGVWAMAENARSRVVSGSCANGHTHGAGCVRQSPPWGALDRSATGNGPGYSSRWALGTCRYLEVLVEPASVRHPA